MSSAAKQIHILPRSEGGNVTIPLRQPLLSRLKSLFTWETLEVAGREVKGFVIPQWAAGVLLAAIVGAFGVMYSANQTQKEMLIRLDQKMADKNDHDQEFREEMKQKFESVMAWQQVTNKTLAKMEKAEKN